MGLLGDRNGIDSRTAAFGGLPLKLLWALWTGLRLWWRRAPGARCGAD